jgi:hypothetical protein
MAMDDHLDPGAVWSQVVQPRSSHALTLHEVDDRPVAHLDGVLRDDAPRDADVIASLHRALLSPPRRDAW